MSNGEISDLEQLLPEEVLLNFNLAVNLADGKEAAIDFLSSVQAPYSSWYDVNRNGLRTIIDREWRGVSRDDWRYAYNFSNEKNFIIDIVNNPLFVHTLVENQFTSKAEFTDAIASEILARRSQAYRFLTLEELILDAKTPQQLVDGIDIYGMMIANATKFEFPNQSITGMRRMVRILMRAGTNMCLNPGDGMADPRKVADAVLPALTSFLEDENLQALEESGKAGILTCITSGLSTTPGTAESVAGVFVTDHLIENGYKSVEQTVIRSQKHRQGERYISFSTLLFLHEKGIIREKISLLPDKAKALETGLRIILNIVHQNSDEGNFKAGQIAGAYDKLRPNSSNSVKNRNLPINTATIIIANSVTPQLNDRLADEMDGTEFEPLEKLDTNRMANILPAFERVMYAVDPSMLEEMLTPLPLEESSDLRLKYIYLEALMQQWNDYGAESQRTLGDFVMRQLARGRSPSQISGRITLLDKRHSDDKASRYYDAIRRYEDSVDPERVKWRRNKPGYGVIS